MIESQRQAYLNEFKGNLFEYLVGRKLSQTFGIERNFLESLQGETQKFLAHYEKELRILDPDLPQNLSFLADKLCLKISTEKRINTKEVERVLLVGKVKEGFKDIEFAESDLVLIGKDSVLPISLKLVKNQSFVNTKSAGVRTFFKKYFESNLAQENINKRIDVIYESMARSLHQNHDLEYTGSFDEWVKLGLPELPGQLEGEDKVSLHKSYQEISGLFYKELQELSQLEGFNKKIEPLVGRGESNLIQVLCFHNGTKEYLYAGHHIEFPSEDEGWKLQAEESSHASIHLHGENKIFQIRIKPMNKFTVASYKVNCSVKYL